MVKNNTPKIKMLSAYVNAIGLFVYAIFVLGEVDYEYYNIDTGSDWRRSWHFFFHWHCDYVVWHNWF